MLPIQADKSLRSYTNQAPPGEADPTKQAIQKAIEAIQQGTEREAQAPNSLTMPQGQDEKLVIQITTTLINANYNIIREMTTNTANREAATNPSPIIRMYQMAIPDLINQATNGEQETGTTGGSNKVLLQSMALMMGTGFEHNQALKTMCILMAQEIPVLLTEYARDMDGTNKRNPQTTPGHSAEMHNTPRATTPRLMELAGLPPTGDEKKRKAIIKGLQTARGNIIIQMINAACLTLEVAAHTAQSTAPTNKPMTEHGIRKIIQTIKGSTIQGARTFCRQQNDEVNNDLKNFLRNEANEGNRADINRLRRLIQETLYSGDWGWTDHPCPTCKGPWNINKHWPLAGIRKHMREGCRRYANYPASQSHISPATTQHKGPIERGPPAHTNGNPPQPNSPQPGYNPEWRPQQRGTRGARGSHPRGTIRQTTTHAAQARDTYSGRGTHKGYNNRGRANHNNANHITIRGNHTATRGNNRIMALNDLTRYGEGLLQHPHHH